MMTQRIPELKKMADRYAKLHMRGFYGVIIFTIVALLSIAIDIIFLHGIPACLMVSCVAILICLHVYRTNKARYNNTILLMKVAKGEFSSLEEAVHYKQLDAETQRAKEQQLRLQEAENIRRAQHPQCPQCHSNNTRRISTSKRIVSTSVLGVASSTIGKQYECLSCKHKW